MNKTFTIKNNWILYSISTLLIVIIVFKVIFEFNLLSSPTDTYKQQFLITENRHHLADMNKNIFLAKTANEKALQSVFNLADLVDSNLEELNLKLVTINTMESIDVLQGITDINNKWYYVEDQIQAILNEPVWIRQPVLGYEEIDSISRINPNYVMSLNNLSKVTNEIYTMHVELNELLLGEISNYVVLVESNTKLSIFLDTLGLMAVISLFIYFSSLSLSISGYHKEDEEKVYAFKELGALDYKKATKKYNISKSA